MASLLYKPDWDETQQRFTAWWRGERMDRCLMMIYGPKDNLPDEPRPAAPSDLVQRWTDLDYIDAVNDYEHRRTNYAGEAFPVWTPWYPGHVCMPTLYGCPFTLAETTGWHSPILTGDPLDISAIRLDRQGRWWQFGDESLARARRSSAGKSIPSIHAFGGVGDTLAAMRGTERLMYDLADTPQLVREAELKIMDDWQQVFSHQVELARGQEGFATWFPIWAPGLFYPMQCDVSYGIGPAAFRECFVPALRKHAAMLQYSLYHLDGVGAFHLVDELCAIEALGGVQVLPGAGKPSPLHYLDVLQTVQRAGKRLHIGIGPEEVPQALEQLSSRGLCIITWVQTEAHAQRLLQQAHTLSKDHT